jgi:dienelactone hydrolase
MRPLIICISLLALFSSSPEQDNPKISTDLVNRARQIVAQLTVEDFAAASADFDSTMAAALSPEKLAEAWKGIKAQLGPIVKEVGARMDEQAGYRIITLTTEFQRATLDIRVTFDIAGKVVGLFFAPAQPSAPFESAPYVDPKAFRKTDVTVGSGEWALPAELTTPQGGDPAPAVVLVHGSGPNDRDETIGPNKPFRDLAEGLASRGIAVLRYDKRTLTHGQKMIEAMEQLTVKEEAVDDAVLAVQMLRNAPGVDPSRIFILGHSLGGTLIPRIAAADLGTAGFIIMAGMARPMEDVIVEQYEYIYSLDGDIDSTERWHLARLNTQAALVKSDSLVPGIEAAQLPLGLPAQYWLDLRGYDPAESAQKIALPMLILQGGRDYQVTEADFELWKKALNEKANTEFWLYPELNHLFIAGKGKIAPDEYSIPGHVSEQVINDITRWITEQ